MNRNDTLAKPIVVERLGSSERVNVRSFLDWEIQDWTVGIGILEDMLDDPSPMPEYIDNANEPQFLVRYTIMNKAQVRAQLDDVEAELTRGYHP